MIPPAFEYRAPRTVADAIGLLDSLGPDAKLLAGGHSLLPMMKLRFAGPSHLIDLGKIDRHWRAAHPDQVAAFETDNRRFRLDVDTLEDIERFERDTGHALRWPAALALAASGATT